MCCEHREQVPRGLCGRRCLCFRFRAVSARLQLREGGEMLPAARGRAGAKFLELAFAVRTMTGEPTVSLPELRSLLASGGARLFDVRSREEAAAGTIPGALNIPAGCLSLPAPPHKLGKWLSFRGDLPDLLCRFVRPQDRSFQTQPLNLRLPNCRLSIVSSRLLLPVSELESALQMEPAAFKALYSAEKPKLEENLIFFCQMGKRGLQATQLARSLGYKGARNYEGAYREWLQKEG
ncbi:thiosulfate:glutathione sulfurtransferase isoform X1 [Moschus berezovskii]|uniref:thiosulfate:glutathione sulfurtransferase isoform X1 n=1 Tax=Moschus berezovskii TaxID=68408 RepID=UPI00244387E4|nr:thiosulfate:glutathione sulfurtransferase isoform X1 [Moschus berezovskii]